MVVLSTLPSAPCTVTFTAGSGKPVGFRVIPRRAPTEGAGLALVAASLLDLAAATSFANRVPWAGICVARLGGLSASGDACTARHTEANRIGKHRVLYLVI